MRFLEKMRQQKLLSITLLVFTLSIGVLIGTLINTAVRAEKPFGGASDATPLTIPNPVQLSTAFSELAKQLEPSVVNVTSTFGPKPSQTKKKRPAEPDEGDPDDEGQGGGMNLFKHFFGQDPDQDHSFHRQGTGSGIVVDRSGYILTNFHVVQDATRIQVKFNNDSTEYAAKLIGSDPETDVAVIKIENAKAPLVPARIGNSDGVQVGDWAVAIGCPFGLEATVTAGIISAKGRDIGGAEHQLQKFIQTDAAINPGNSGGPLLALNGSVIGINTAIETESGGYQGIGFALPINTAVNVYNQLIKTGRVSRGSLGVGFSPDQKPETLKVYGANHGVFVTNVEAGSPADKAGIKVEDVIVDYNGRSIKDGDDLVSRVSATPVGSQASLAVLRGGKRMDFKVTIGERAKVWASDPRFMQYQQSEPEGDSAPSPVKFGLDIQNLSQSVRQSAGLGQKGGVVVTKVADGSFAEDIGLLPHDVITSINRREVSSVDDVRHIQSALKPGDAVVVRAMRPLSKHPNHAGDWQAVFLSGTLPVNP